MHARTTWHLTTSCNFSLGSFWQWWPVCALWWWGEPGETLPNTESRLTPHRKACRSWGSNPWPPCCEELVLTTLPYAGTIPTVSWWINKPPQSWKRREAVSHSRPGRITAWWWCFYWTGKPGTAPLAVHSSAVLLLLHFTLMEKTSGWNVAGKRG